MPDDVVQDHHRGVQNALRVGWEVLASGGSALKAIERCHSEGLHVLGVVALVDREEGGREALEKEAPLVTLFRRRDFT